MGLKKGMAWPETREQAGLKGKVTTQDWFLTLGFFPIPSRGPGI
jgi:hypothetical protein